MATIYRGTRGVFVPEVGAGTSDQAQEPPAPTW